MSVRRFPSQGQGLSTGDLGLTGLPKAMNQIKNKILEGNNGGNRKELNRLATEQPSGSPELDMKLFVKLTPKFNIPSLLRLIKPTSNLGLHLDNMLRNLHIMTPEEKDVAAKGIQISLDKSPQMGAFDRLVVQRIQEILAFQARQIMVNLSSLPVIKFK